MLEKELLLISGAQMAQLRINYSPFSPLMTCQIVDKNNANKVIIELSGDYRSLTVEVPLGTHFDVTNITPSSAFARVAPITGVEMIGYKDGVVIDALAEINLNVYDDD